MADPCDYTRTLTLPDVAATEALGVALGRELRAGQAVGLLGPMGAGKTALARGLARGLGVDDPTAVRSPTYLLVVEHPGPVAMLHVDAYLADKTRGFLVDGGADYLGEAEGVAVVEWADRIADLLPAATLWVELSHAPDGRHAQIRGARDAFGWLGSIDLGG